MTETEMDLLIARADLAGTQAAMGITPRHMVVTGMQGQRYDVPEGPCGFAWVTLRPGTSRLARYMKKLGIADKAYGGGVQVWVSAFGQSIDRKEAYARAYAQVLQEAGIQASPGSRMD